MTLFDFFDAVELPVPAVTAQQATQIAAARFRVDAQVAELGSQQDANFLLSTAAGQPIGVLKIANPAFSRAELEAQDAAAAFIDAAENPEFTAYIVDAIAAVPTGFQDRPVDEVVIESVTVDPRFEVTAN